MPINNKEYIIQLNVYHSIEKKYLLLNNLKKVLHRDPDLHNLPSEHLNLIMQSLYISTGCDYISYFRSFGKATIINVFMQHATFVNGMNSQGNLHETDFLSRERGFLAFLRLVGTCYFKRHYKAMVAIYSTETPTQLFNSIDDSLSPSQKHEAWLQKIRRAVSTVIINEEDRVPTYTSLWRHWMRACWVHQMWQQSHYANVYSSLPPPEQSGWKKNGSDYTIDWEADDVMEEIQETIKFLTKGCSCKKGCTNNNCGCKKRSNHCGPGCECVGCMNLPVVAQQQQCAIVDSSSDEDDTDDNNLPYSDDDLESTEDLETELITDEFLLDSVII